MNSKYMIKFTAVLHKEENMYVALCPELGVVSQGYTVKEAVANLKEAVELYIEEMGVPKEDSNDTIIVNFEVEHAKAKKIIRA